MGSGLEADQVKAQKRFSVEKPHLLILSPMCLAFSHLTAGKGQASLGVCLQSGRIAGRARWTRSLRTSLGGDVVKRTVPEQVVGDRWHAQGPMRSMSVRNDFG